MEIINKYKYFYNVKKEAAFTENKCQFCGSKEDCLEGIYFNQDNIDSVCLRCFAEKKAGVDIPDYIQKRIKYDPNKKIQELKYTPPIPWVQYNDWQVCCDDYMKYIGEWEQEEFIKVSENESKNEIEFFREMLNGDTLKKVDDINVLWEDLGYDTVAYVFKCSICGKRTVVCQSY